VGCGAFLYLLLKRFAGGFEASSAVFLSVSLYLHFFFFKSLPIVKMGSRPPSSGFSAKMVINPF